MSDYISITLSGANLIALVGFLIRVSFNFGKLTEQSDETKRDLNALGRKVESNHRIASDTAAQALSAMKAIAEGLVTRKELVILIKQYDEKVCDSKGDRRSIWEAIDRLGREKQDKQDCQVRGH